MSTIQPFGSRNKLVALGAKYALQEVTEKKISKLTSLFLIDQNDQSALHAKSYFLIAIEIKAFLFLGKIFLEKHEFFDILVLTTTTFFDRVVKRVERKTNKTRKRKKNWQQPMTVFCG